MGFSASEVILVFLRLSFYQKQYLSVPKAEENDALVCRSGIEEVNGEL